MLNTKMGMHSKSHFPAPDQMTLVSDSERLRSTRSPSGLLSETTIVTHVCATVTAYVVDE